MNARLRIAILIGSTREGRFGPTAARWIEHRARARADLDVDVIDLADVDLPATYPNDPGHLAPMLARLRRADGFIVVTPEYNHSFPASLKQAIDVAHSEWRAKPVSFVSYGASSGGLRAVEQLRLVFAELQAVGLRDTVSFHCYWEALDDEGELDDRGDAPAEILLDQLTWWAEALRDARRRCPSGPAEPRRTD
jgi:NAD(P)H-dependent FMN reductase